MQHNTLWITKGANNNQLDFWSTCLYLINIKVMRDAINKLAVYDERGRLRMKAIAGILRPCIPESCCDHSNNRTDFIYEPPCVYSPRGFQSDAFIYASVKYYIIPCTMKFH